MSYDLQIWSVHPTSLDSALNRGEWESQGPGWRILINKSAEVGAQDVPASVSAVVPGAHYLTELNLEGTASDAALGRLKRIAESLARASQGTVVDPQQSSPIDNDRNRMALLSMAWWFQENPFDAPGGWDRFLSLLELHLPEALPLRYGTHEPPEFTLRQTGRGHLEKFLSETSARKGFAVWYPARPVREVSFSFPNPPGESRAGFRANCLFLKVEASVLEQPGREEQLRELWLNLSLFLRPFYGDVRTLRGFLPSRSTYASDAKTDKHPVMGWFWKGVPDSLGLAAVLGRGYESHWPKVPATRIEGLAFASVASWRSGGELTGLSIPPE